jgi:FkbM family methyltransferase
MKRLILKALSAAGVQVMRVRSDTGKTSTLTFRNLRAKGSRVHLAMVVQAPVAGKEVSFYVENQADFIQGIHATGHFYEEEELAIIAKYFPKGGVFVDVGANVGNHSLYVGLFLAARKIIAFEPLEEASRILRCNVALNSLTDIMVHHQVGLAAAAGTATIAEAHDCNLGGTRLASGEGALTLLVGDSVLAGEQVDFIKIDTEGMELGVLEGLRETIRRCRPALFVEVEDANEAAFLTFLEQVGYQPSETYKRYAVNTNYLALPVANGVVA